MKRSTAFIGLGANLGDRLATLRSAVVALEGHPDIEVVAASHAYETIPVGPSTEPFLNAAATVSTTLAPAVLLGLLHGIERQHGRQRRVRWDARTLDLDLLLQIQPDGTPAEDADGCRLPHPAMLERDFVLAPLAELAPDLVVGGETVREHLAAIPEAARTILRRLDPLGGPG